MSEQDLPRSQGDIELIAAVDAYLQQHFGPVAGVYHEEQSDLVHLDVHYVAPSPSRPYYTLMTSGMAEKPMHVDEGLEEWRFCELALHVSPTWVACEGGLDHSTFWPIDLIKGMATYPHEEETWLGPGHSVPLVYAAGHPLAHYGGVVLFPAPIGAPQFFETANGRSVGICRVVPLYPQELAVKVDKGMDGLREMAIQAGVRPEELYVAQERRKPMQKRPWLFGK